MRKSKKHEYRQAYNAQAVVDAGGSKLTLGAQVSWSALPRLDHHEFYRMGAARSHLCKEKFPCRNANNPEKPSLSARGIDAKC